MYGNPTPSCRLSSTFFLLKCHDPEASMGSGVNVFMHAICKRSKKYLVREVGNLGSLELIPMIQPPINSRPLFNIPELFYNMSLPPSFSIKRFPSYTATKKSEIFSTTTWYFCVSTYIYIYTSGDRGSWRLFTQLNESNKQLEFFVIVQVSMDVLKMKSGVPLTTDSTLVLSGKPGARFYVGT